MITLDYAPYSYQAEFHSSDTRYELIVGGRRVGKSKMALMELVKHCLERPKAVAWWVAPTITMAREIGWAEFKDLADVLSPGIYSMHETLLRVEFLNGSTLYFKGADNERSLRGRGLTYLVIDEAAFVDPDVWTQVLYPALVDKQGRALLISTPNGRNWFYDQYLHVQSDPRWKVRHWPTAMNPLISPDDLEMSKQMVSELDFRQEFLAEFVTKSGMVYDDFSDDNILDSIALHPDWDYYLGVDFGYANPSAIGFFAVDSVKQTVYLFDEIYIARRSITELEALIEDVLIYNGLTKDDISYVYTDPAGNAAELSSGISPVDHLRKAGYSVNNMGSEISPGLALVRSFIKSASGKRSFFVHSKCKEAIRSINGYTYAKRSGKTEEIKEEALKDGIHDHFCDAIRYFFVNQFQQNRWISVAADTYDYSGTIILDEPILKTCQGCRSKFISKTPKLKPPHYCKDCINK